MVFWVCEFQGDLNANLHIFWEKAKPVEKMLKQKSLHLPCLLNLRANSRFLIS